MSARSKKKMFRFAVILLIVVSFLVMWQARRPASQSATATAPVQSQSPASHSAKGTFQAVATRTTAETTGQRLARLLSGTTESTEHKLSPIELAEYLHKHKTNAFTLVTAFGMSRDPQYLKMAAALHPEDPLVQAQVLLHDRDLSPAERQKWIEAFKKCSPNNSFANLLSAKEYLDAGLTASALQEITSASGKTFDDFTREIALGQEEAYINAGRPIAEAKALGSAEVLLPHLAQFKSVGVKLSDFAQEAAARGDASSQIAALEAVWQVAQQLRQSGSKGVVITDLVGLALENIALSRWPQDVEPHFLDRPVAEQRDANRQYRADIRQATESIDPWMRNATDAELISYFDRMRVFGEMNALNWVRSQQSPANQ